MIKKSIDMAITIRYIIIIIIVSLFCLSIVMTIAVFIANVYADSEVSSNTTKKNSTNLISVGQPPSNILNSNSQPIVNAGSGVGGNGSSSSSNRTNQVIGPVIAKNYGISSSSSRIGPSKPITKEDAMKAYDKANAMVKAYDKANPQSGSGARTTTTTAVNATQQQQQQQQQLIIQNDGSSSSTTALPPPTSSEPTEIPGLPGIIP